MKTTLYIQLSKRYVLHGPYQHILMADLKHFSRYLPIHTFPLHVQTRK